MTLEGIINNIVSTGGYPGNFGYMYTFNMTIDCQGKFHTGEIKSKSEVYPVAIGQPITVLQSTDQHGVKFQKQNPQYENQDQQPPQPQPQAPQPQPQPQPPRPAQAPNDVQDNIRFAQALNLSEADCRHDKIDLCRMEAQTNIYYNILKSRQFPANMKEAAKTFEQNYDLPPQGSLDDSGNPV